MFQVFLTAHFKGAFRALIVIAPRILRITTDDDKSVTESRQQVITISYYVFRRATVQKETHVQRDGSDVDHQTDQDQGVVPVATVDRSGRRQEDPAQGPAVRIPAVGPLVQALFVLPPPRLQVLSLPPPQGKRQCG